MLNVFRSNRTERLVDALADVIMHPPAGPLVREIVAVDSAGMRSWLLAELADRLGIAAGIALPLPRDLIQDFLGRALGDALPDLAAFRGETPWFALHELVLEHRSDAAFAEVAAYLENDERGLKHAGLVSRIAQAFDQYAVYRPEMVLAWERGAESHWQAILWRALVRRLGSGHMARAAEQLFSALAAGAVPASAFPTRVSLFGVGALPPLFLRILSSLPAAVMVDLFIVSPSGEWLPDAGEGLGHPLLDSSCKVARDLQRLLEELGSYTEPAGDLHEDPAASGAPGLLAAIQSELLDLGARRVDPALAGRSVDRSIAVHSCASRQREVEALKDQLLALFDDTRLGIGPDDVIVLWPESGVYAPIVEAVLAAGPGEPEIPFQIWDQAIEDEPAAARVVMQLLALSRARLTVREVVDFLSLRPVRGRFGLSADEIERAAAAALQAGVRYGIDAAHRRALGQAGFEENTWRFGLNRLLLGAALPEGDLFCGVLPFAAAEGGDAELLGRFAEFAEVLFAKLAELARPRDLPSWFALLPELVSRFLAPDREPLGEERLFRDACDRWRGEAERAVCRAPVSAAALERFLCERLAREHPQRIAGNGGVSFGTLRAFRGRPAKVVCLLGMEFGGFPRARSTTAFDLIAARPRIGDPAPSAEDRDLFLHALLAARERLIIFFVGQDDRVGAKKPPAVPVSELVDLAAERYGVRDLVVEHPLQPFSPRYFACDRDPRLFSFDSVRCLDACALGAGARRERPFSAAPLASPAGPGVAVTLADLVRFFRDPAAAFLADRLGVRPAAVPEEPPEAEPIEAGGLAGYAVGQEVLAEALRGGSCLALFERFRAQGVLPLGTAGAVRFARIAREAEEIAAAARERGRGEPLPPRDLSLDLAVDGRRVRLTGRVADLWPSGRVVARYSRLKIERIVELWINHLALGAAGGGELARPSTWIGRGDKGKVEQHTLGALPGDPQALLVDLLDLYFAGQTLPLPLVWPATWSDALGLIDGDAERAAAAREKLDAGRDDPGGEPVARTAFAGRDPFDEAAWPAGLSFSAVTARVLGPIAACYGKGDR